jgi:pheromone shutdown protein TraB
VLIDDRNKFMADRLKDISAKHGNVFAVIGDGHIPGIMEQLRPLEVKAIRLRDVRTGEQGALTKAEFSATYFYDQH